MSYVPHLRPQDGPLSYLDVLSMWTCISDLGYEGHLLLPSSALKDTYNNRSKLSFY